MNTFTVVKIGGASLEDTSQAVARILEARSGPTAVVHGGGKQITRMLERFHVESRFIDGLRVTDEQTLASVAAALLGEVQTSLVAALQRAGLAAAGVFGAVHAAEKAGPWGLVGTEVTADAATLRAALEAGIMPVIPTLAIGTSSLLNVNGDETAAAVAIALRARALIFLTDVDGVRNAEGVTLERVPPGVSLVNEPFISGGMKPKLRAVEAALQGGVASVRVGRTIFGAA
ncbi:MAG TPA: acetylglutamate kinase [Terriglobia bacterium]|nr:acetylglutamate kinase [Terriglobia bacterium]